MSENNRKLLISTRKLKKYFPVKKGVNLKAVNDVTLKIYEGEKFGVVGESGCGKSTLGRVILQLYPQTSGSCVYYGKSIQELNPKYIQKEINHLKTYQDKASKFYQDSLVLDGKVKILHEKRGELDPDGSSNDAKNYDKISKDIAKLEFESKELKKNASRQLREGSRTVGSLILCSNIEEIADLFTKAEQEVAKAHACLVKYNDLKSRYEENEVSIHQKKNVDQWILDIEEREAKEESDENKQRLYDLDQIKKRVAHVDVDKLLHENETLKPQLDALSEQIKEHHDIEMGYRDKAFSYRGKNILEITERTLDEAYQKKLDDNYETGLNLNKLTKVEMRSIRSDMQMIFQDPAASLDPRQTIGKAIEEALAINTKLPAQVRREKTMELLNKVGLKREHYYSYPHALSGGQKQRVGIARAIALEPSFIILDEAVSALDVSVQAQILQLLNELSEEKNLTYFFITHDLGVVKHFCDRIMVMYLGNVCEMASSEELFHNTLHPYTQSLLDAVPRLKVEENKDLEKNVLEGEVPSPINPPSGCPFHTRCKKCMEICKHERPELTEVDPNHFVACHLFNKENS